MTKADIASKIQSKLGLSRKESEELLESVLGIMKSTLESGEKLKINGFGSFLIKDKNPRRGRNPQTGESIILDGRRILTFKASQILKDAVNTPAAKPGR